MGDFESLVEAWPTKARLHLKKWITLEEGEEKQTMGPQPPYPVISNYSGRYPLHESWLWNHLHLSGPVRFGHWIDATVFLFLPMLQNMCSKAMILEVFEFVNPFTPSNVIREETRARLKEQQQQEWSKKRRELRQERLQHRGTRKRERDE